MQSLTLHFIFSAVPLATQLTLRKVSKLKLFVSQLTSSSNFQFLIIHKSHSNRSHSSSVKLHRHLNSLNSNTARSNSSKLGQNTLSINNNKSFPSSHPSSFPHSKNLPHLLFLICPNRSLIYVPKNLSSSNQITLL